MYWDKKDFFNINKSPLEDFDKEKLFYWFCKNHQKDAPEELLKPIKKVNKNLKENENLFEEINDNGNFDQIIDNNSKTIFTIQENYEFWNGIYKFYDLYFFHGFELDTIGPLSLEKALEEHYITQERDDDQLLDIEYDEGEITWKQIQSIMSSNKPSLDAEIMVNNKHYIHKSNGLWIAK
ncbi:hypothetical protein OAT42_02275 [Alphaproteobacteria bacterium]|nr:hypothetical protein [Alphaproteobacteria bacterium]